jgi:hypothetical protein
MINEKIYVHYTIYNSYSSDKKEGDGLLIDITSDQDGHPMYIIMTPNGDVFNAKSYQIKITNSKELYGDGGKPEQNKDNS